MALDCTGKEAAFAMRKRAEFVQRNIVKYRFAAVLYFFKRGNLSVLFLTLRPKLN